MQRCTTLKDGISFTFLQQDLLQWEAWKDCLPYCCPRKTAVLGGHVVLCFCCWITSAGKAHLWGWVAEEMSWQGLVPAPALECSHYCSWSLQMVSGIMIKASWCCSAPQKTKFAIFADSSPQPCATALARTMSLTWQDPLATPDTMSS